MIKIENLYKHYTLGKQVVPVLRGLNLSILKNEYVALMGPSGSGKSTLMNIIGCLDTPTAGKYILNGNNVSTIAENSLAEIRNQEIGFVFQQFNLLPRLNALENVALPLVYCGIGKKAREERAREVLEKVHLSDRWHHKPNELSGGQCQRVAIARALINNPSIILADEPTGNLDSKTSVEIMEIFDTIHKAGNTVILVTHEEEISRFAKRIIRLKDGLIDNESVQNNEVREKIEIPSKPIDQPVIEPKIESEIQEPSQPEIQPEAIQPEPSIRIMDESDSLV
ncbi:MAG: ATP-binding cassette domain-containing protein [Bacteroidetes bacterium]|nr:ATP-binding cassette domain-containing protein [Bacteroidota bacterium]